MLACKKQIISRLLFHENDAGLRSPELFRFKLLADLAIIEPDRDLQLR